MENEKQYKVKQPCQKCFSLNTEHAGIDYSDDYGDELLKCNDCGHIEKVWNGKVFFRRLNEGFKKLGLPLATQEESVPEKENEYEVRFLPFQNKEDNKN